MKNRNRRAQAESEIAQQWHDRQPEERTPKHVEEFAEDLCRKGLYLHQDSTLNIQHVRGLLRAY